MTFNQGVRGSIPRWVTKRVLSEHNFLHRAVFRIYQKTQSRTLSSALCFFLAFIVRLQKKRGRARASALAPRPLFLFCRKLKSPIAHLAISFRFIQRGLSPLPSMEKLLSSGVYHSHFVAVLASSNRFRRWKTPAESLTLYHSRHSPRSRRRQSVQRKGPTWLFKLLHRSARSRRAFAHILLRRPSTGSGYGQKK